MLTPEYTVVVNNAHMNVTKYSISIITPGNSDRNESKYKKQCASWSMLTISIKVHALVKFLCSLFMILTLAPHREYGISNKVTGLSLSTSPKATPGVYRAHTRCTHLKQRKFWWGTPTQRSKMNYHLCVSKTDRNFSWSYTAHTFQHPFLWICLQDLDTIHISKIKDNM